MDSSEAVAHAIEFVESAERFHNDGYNDDAQHRRESAIVYALVAVVEEIRSLKIRIS